MKIKTFSILSFTLFLISCQQNAHSSVWYGLSGIGYQYDYPGIFEFCGTEYINDFSFALYCFEDFRAMGRCVSSEPERKKYSECNFQASIHVDVEPKSTITNSEDLLNEKLQNKFSSYNVTFLSIKKDTDDFVIAEIHDDESSDSNSPIYMIVLPHGNDYFAVITGQTSKSGKANKTWSAFEIFAKSYGPAYGTRINPMPPEPQ
jgi:hypothetical protein